MLSEKNAKKILIQVLLPIFIAVISFSVLSDVVPKSKPIQSTLKSIEDSNTTVLTFTGATLAASLSVSALPDDFGTPIANNFASMSKYFVIILSALFIEKMIVLIGVKISFMYVIPCGLILIVLANFTKKDMIKSIAKKIIILGIALVIVVPCSVKFTNSVGAEYLEYVDKTIEDTDGGANKINDEIKNGDENSTIFEKLSDVLNSAIKGVSDLLSYFNDMTKKCMNSIVILIVANFLMPIATLLLFRWILKELFGLSTPIAPVQNWVKKDGFKRKSNLELIEEEE